MYVGDFNSHHSEWGYADCDADGESLVEWASTNDLILIHDAKQRDSFHSARWGGGRDYSPDLCWVTSLDGHQQQATCTVLENFPHIQHRPSLIHIGLQLPGAIYKAACGAIPRGHRPVYNPCLDSECAALLREYESFRHCRSPHRVTQRCKVCSLGEGHGRSRLHPPEPEVVESNPTSGCSPTTSITKPPTSNAKPRSQSPTEGNEGANGEECQTAGP